MVKISMSNWGLLLSWPAAVGYGVAYLLPPKNLMGLVLGILWLSGWLVVFVRDQRSARKFLLSSAPPQAPCTGAPP